MGWYPVPVPRLDGRTYVVTGANSGLGFFTSARLAAAGASVTLTGRNAGRLDAALAAIRERVPAARVQRIVIDQSSLSSVRAGVDAIAGYDALHGLIANAGMVHTPRLRETSVDGNELVLATNVLGHFALIAGVLPALERAGDARVVSVGSLSSRLSDLRLDDLQLLRHYDSWRAYAQSKIVGQVIGFELERRLRVSGSPVESIVAHPGYSITGRTPRVAGVTEPGAGTRFVDNLQAPFTQGKHRGAEPIVHAAAAAEVRGGQYWGPAALVKGVPQLQHPTATSTDPAVAATVWRLAEEFTGTEFAIA